MFANFLAIAVLASVVLMPLTLYLGGCRMESLYETPRSTFMRYASYFVAFLQAITAVAWLFAKTRFLGEPVVLWGMVLLFAYLWSQTLVLFRAGQQSR